MLQRTLEKQGPEAPRRLTRGVKVGIATAVIAILAYFLLPEPGPKMRPVALGDAELAVAAAALTKEQPPAGHDAADVALADFGRDLFHDTALSSNGEVACASCHFPLKQFVDHKPRAVGVGATERNTPTVVNVGMNTWFHWDGRTDSLASQALKPIEEPREHGVSRVFVVRRLIDHYAEAYEKSFGKLPAVLTKAQLPPHAMPRTAPPKLSLDVAAYSLATLGSFPLLSDILSAAQSSRLAPAMELSRRAFAKPEVDPAWHDAWDKLPPETQEAVNEAFGNFGRAIAAYERGIVALDSPFDRFAHRLQRPEMAGKPPTNALGAEFGEREWEGFKLFTGPARCVLCHNGPNFTDQQFHNIGLAQGEGGLAIGRAAGALMVLADPFNCTKPPLAKDPLVANGESCRELPFLDTESFELIGAFKTPSLRNVAMTAPYMHDGRFATLDDVLDHYDELAVKPATGHREESLKPLELTSEEREALKAFLSSLTSPIRDINAEATVSAKAP